MTPHAEEKKLGKERLQRIIEMCVAIESRQVDPFTLNVDDIIAIVKQYFPHWNHPDELRLDAEALHHLASVIKMQSEWVKQRSTSLYTDPFLLEEKIRQTSKEGMVEVFASAWTPLVEFEQLSLSSLAQGLLYWEALAPLGDRWKDIDVSAVEMGMVSREEMVKARVLGNREFGEELECYWAELKQKAASTGKIPYWDFIGAESYEETVQRAFLTSFLVTYGYATLEIDRLEETVTILPYIKRREEPLSVQSTSVPIAVSVEDWQKWKQGKQP
ncbi:MAG: non-structural maintenance of chromosomes element 4 [Candidatus Bathyarchaeota archaeon]|nr:non-structural maintenance of chromosomes element 4 [Candidatus Bathyarchaeota archaeon]